MFKLFLSILALGLFCGGYGICFLVYPDFENHANEWFDLRMAIYAVIMALCFYIPTLKANEQYIKHINFVSYIAIGFSASSVMDKLICGITNFTYSDYILIPFTIIISYYKVYARKI